MAETYIYMIRHAVSPFVLGSERTRGLSAKGHEDALKIADILKNEGIDVFVSSGYLRAVETVRPLAERMGKSIRELEALNERAVGSMEIHIPEEQLLDGIRRSFIDKDFCLPGGESTRRAQERALPVVQALLKEQQGRKIAMGTHGNIMTILLNAFDESYGFEFWTQTSKPDIYKLTWEDQRLARVERLWDPNA